MLENAHHLTLLTPFLLLTDSTCPIYNDLLQYPPHPSSFCFRPPAPHLPSHLPSHHSFRSQAAGLFASPTLNQFVIHLARSAVVFLLVHRHIIQFLIHLVRSAVVFHQIPRQIVHLVLRAPNPTLPQDPP